MGGVSSIESGEPADNTEAIAARLGRAAPKPLTILQLTRALNDGTSERGAVEIAAAITEAGGRALVASSGGLLERRLRAAGGHAVELPLDRGGAVALRRNARAIARLIRDENVDLVHARSRGPAWSGFWAAKATGAPFVTSYERLYQERSPLRRSFNRILTKGSPVLTVSDFVSAVIAKRYGLDPDHLVTIPQGVDLAVFNEGAVAPQRVIQLLQRWRIEDDSRPVFLAPAGKGSVKERMLFVDAAARLRRERGPAFLALMLDDGSGQDEDMIESRIQKQGATDCVFLGGRCADIPAAYLLARCVISTAERPEAFSQTSIEAQAMGRPVIAPDHGAAVEAVAHGQTGWLFRQGDAESLAETMALALDLGPSRSAHMGLAAAARTRAMFSLEAVKARTLRIYEEASGRQFYRYAE